MTLAMKLNLAPRLAPGGPQPQTEILRTRIDRMVRLLRAALSGGVGEDLEALLRDLAAHQADLERATAAWVELISALVQAAEHRHPDARGRLKKAQVKAAIRYLVRADRFHLPDLPAWLEPMLMDLVVDWSIDVVVDLTNQHGLWNLREPVPTSPSALLGAVLRDLADLTRPVWLWAVGLCLRVWESLQERTVFTPELRRALDQAAEAGLVRQKGELFGKVPQLVVWVADHRARVAAAFRLVFEAVQDAESFAEKSGPEKKSYARDLVLAALEEFGVPVGDGLFSMILGAMVDSVIESAVNLFNKFPTHGPAFKHRRPA